MTYQHRPWLYTLVYVTSIGIAAPAWAYVGPGAGLTAIGSILALVSALFLALVGFVWYPVKRMLRRKRQEPAAAEVSEEKSEQAPQGPARVPTRDP